ncbi:hypothetical protein SAMN04515665_101397 [Blastococcus sp. DSM 46786]|uniref:hypothetical protein n=1 Tax=Blastococcus sp. DSM 46786 TaxID=1798227 RepID=UPI0008B2CDE6|nr:hypothetical protein [Blastococcus sp. DSM 46786]SEK32111.1 hypothetical protein SAMN04515665_101397 [Blastococcus sp. DSM 46786]
MSDARDDRAVGDRPSPSPRTRSVAGARPSPRPRVAGSRRERSGGEPVAEAATPTTGGVAAPAADPGRSPSTARPRSRRAAGAPGAAAGPAVRPARRRIPATVLALALLATVAAAGIGVLLWQRSNPAHVDPSIFAAARSGIEAVYAYDHEDSEGSVQRKLDALTGDLREQYERDLSQGGIIDTYEQVSATTRYEVLDVGLQQVNDAQDTATLVVFGQYVVESVNSGTQPAPEGSECQVTPEGAQSCVQTVQVRLVQVDDDWKISELTLLTTS